MVDLEQHGGRDSLLRIAGNPEKKENEGTNAATPLGWGLLSQFSPFRYFPHFRYCQNKRWLLNIAFIFGRCRRSSAAMAPVKYECDWDNLTGAFTRSKILRTEKLTNGDLVFKVDPPVQLIDIAVSHLLGRLTEGNNGCNCQIRDKERCSPKKELKNVHRVEIELYLY